MSRTERSADLKLVSSYLRLASSYIALRKPLLMITHGFSGSGKTSFATQLAPLCDAVCLHSDVERKRLYQIAANENSHSPIAGGIYSISSGLKTYNRLCHLADTLLKAGITVIIDATFIKKTAREQVIRLAQDHQVPLLILDFHLAEDELRRRLKLRSKQAKSVSEAGEEILDYQRGQEDPLCEQELKNSMIIHQDTEVAQIAKQVIKMQHQAQVRRKQVG
jgi:predicted kinase